MEAPIEMGLLERACVGHPRARPEAPGLPGKNKKVMMVGSDLSSLTAAWDLARKGYKVSLFEPGDALGGGLREIAPELLPREVIDRETAALGELGVELHFNVDVETEEFLEGLIRDADAVYVGLDGVERRPPGRLRGTRKGGSRSIRQPK